MSNLSPSGDLQSQASLSGVEGPASKNPLEDRSLDPEVRLANGIEHIDSQMQRLGDALAGTTDVEAQERITEDISKLSERRLQLELQGVQYVEVLDALHDLQTKGWARPEGSTEIPSELRILREASSPEVIEILSGKYGLGSKDSNRQKLVLQICTGRQEERIADGILHLNAPSSEAQPEALIAAAHLRDPRAPRVLSSGVPNLTLDAFCKLTESIDSAVRRRAVIRIGLNGNDEMKFLALNALKQGDADIIVTRIESLFRSGEIALAAMAIQAVGRIWDEELDEAFSAGRFQGNLLVVGAAISEVPIKQAQPVAEALGEYIREQLSAGKLDHTEARILAFDPTEVNVEILKKLHADAITSNRLAAFSALAYACRNLQILGDPNKVAKSTKIESIIKDAFSDRAAVIRNSAVRSRDPENKAHRRQLLKLLKGEQDEAVADVACQILAPLKDNERHKIIAALESNGHLELRDRLASQAGN